MVRISRYAHTFDLGDDVALYHSLRMKPVYLNKKAYEDLQAWLAGPFCNDYDDAPDNIKNEVNELVKFKILTINEQIKKIAQKERHHYLFGVYCFYLKTNIRKDDVLWVIVYTIQRFFTIP